MDCFNSIPNKELTLNEGDYQVDGVWYCGCCRTPKQIITNFRGKEFVRNCLCSCQDEALAKEQERLQKQEEAAKVSRARSIGITDPKLHGFNFQNDDKRDQRLSAAARKYADNFSRFKSNGRGLLIFGSVGAGKTFYAVSIANRIIEDGYSALVTNFPRIINRISGTFEDKQGIIDNLNRYDLLVLDDLGTERNTGYSEEIVFQVVDGRVRSGKPMIITTNHSSHDLKNPMDISFQRICSRLFEVCIPIEVIGQKDRRIEKAKERIEEDKRILGL